MQTSTIRLYSLNYAEIKTYLTAALFIAGNIILPQLFHLMPQGGVTWLPIYFFTFIAAYKYGWKAGLLTALLSPAINSVLFGMPMTSALPAIMLKSMLLAVIAGYVAHRYNRVSVALLLATVLLYQVAGTLGEWVMKGDFYLAIQDFRIGIPGMLLQVFGGYMFIRYLLKR